MKYDAASFQYRIGLGLWFSILTPISKGNHFHKVVSNIPSINGRTLNSTTEASAIVEVTGLIQSGLNFTQES